MSRGHAANGTATQGRIEPGGPRTKAKWIAGTLIVWLAPKRPGESNTAIASTSTRTFGSASDCMPISVFAGGPPLKTATRAGVRLQRGAMVLSDLRAAGPPKRGDPARADGVPRGLDLHDQGPPAGDEPPPLRRQRDRPTGPGPDAEVLAQRIEGREELGRGRARYLQPRSAPPRRWERCRLITCFPSRVFGAGSPRSREKAQAWIVRPSFAS